MGEYRGGVGEMRFDSEDVDLALTIVDSGGKGWVIVAIDYEERAVDVAEGWNDEGAVGEIRRITELDLRLYSPLVSLAELTGSALS